MEALADNGTILLLFVACLVAYFLKGFSGFGPALVYIPTVSLLMSPAVALASSAFIDLLVGAGLALTLRYEPGDGALVFRMASSMLIGTVVGASLAGVVSEQITLFLIGLAVVGLGIRLLMTLHVPSSPGQVPPRLFWLGCTAGGFTGGLVGISGPFIVAASRSIMDKSRFRRVLVAVFLIEGAAKLAIYGIVGVFSQQAFIVAAVAAPGVLVGLLVGYRMHRDVSEIVFSSV
ncbi:MAG: sulfite exporter TauE/SafE family protein, partial [Dehalococcoidia bacterium]